MCRLVVLELQPRLLLGGLELLNEGLCKTL